MTDDNPSTNSVSYSQEVNMRDLEKGILKYDNSQKKSSNGFLECCGACSLVIMVMALLAGAIAYLVFGIMYLVQDYKIANDCAGSGLWAYVLTAIILAWGRGNAKNTSTKDGDMGTPFCTLVCLGIVDAGLAIWGGIELFQYSCSDLQDSNIWKFGLVTFCLQAFFATLFLVIMPIVLCCMARNS